MSRRILSAWIVVIVALSSAVLWLWLDRPPYNDTRLREDVQTAAATAVETVLSYSATTVASDLATAEELTTGDFKKRLRATASDIVERATKGKISTSAVVSEVGVVSINSESEVTLLMFVNQNTTTKKSATTPRQQGTRLKVTMSKVGGRWLIARLDQI